MLEIQFLCKNLIKKKVVTYKLDMQNYILQQKINSFYMKFNNYIFFNIKLNIKIFANKIFNVINNTIYNNNKS